MFDILASEISQRSGGQYTGPNLVVDARHWRNEAALANCVFGSGQTTPNLQAEVRHRVQPVGGPWHCEHGGGSGIAAQAGQAGCAAANRMVRRMRGAALAHTA